jgi:hypothetical protein
MLALTWLLEGHALHHSLCPGRQGKPCAEGCPVLDWCDMTGCCRPRAKALRVCAPCRDKVLRRMEPAMVAMMNQRVDIPKPPKPRGPR